MPQPILYSGLRVPFDQLEAEPFASFVHGVLQVLAEVHKWREFAQSNVGADAGFDSTARRQSDNALVCFQCKRYSEPISTPDLAAELARLTFSQDAENIKVSEYVLITSGTVREVLRKALRDADRSALVAKAIELCTTDERFKASRKRFSKGEPELVDAIRTFVSTVNTLPPPQVDTIR